jgi:hypothetical protein
MECTHPDVAGFFTGHHFDARAHFGSSFIGKSKSQYIERINTVINQIGYPGGKHACFTRAGPGNDQ